MEMDIPIAFAAKHDPDTMYFHQAVKQGHWQIIPIEEVPKGTKIFDAVWAMKQKKRDIETSQDNQAQSQDKCA
eukprot:1911403-Ditylum_brightwellii.AAC.1